LKIFLKIISFIGLGLTLIPSIFVFIGSIEFTTHKFLMIFGSALWFTTTPFWVKKESEKTTEVS